MTFFEISKKMLIANFSKYRLYFFCNLFAVSLFYCFASVFTNKSFMNEEIVNSLISGNIYFPSLLSALYLIVFLPVSFQAFLASRKQEYGILFSLGMSRKETFCNMLLENMIIAVLSLSVALVVGTALSYCFFSIIIYVIGIQGVRWELCLEAYMATALLYAVVMAVTVIWNVVKLLHDKIGTLLKSQYCLEKNGAVHFVLCRFFPGYMRNHILEWSFVRRHKREWGLRYVLATLIIACSVTLVSVCVALCPSFLRDAESYSPYDMVYSEIYGMNQAPVQNVIKILEENGTTVKQVTQLPYIRDASCNYISETAVNQCFGCDYQIKEGQFLNLFQFDLQDGYEHDLQPIGDITLDGNENLYSAGSDVKILFNKNPTFADRTLIVSDSDYEKMKADTQRWSGLANLFLFEQWDCSYHGVCAVDEYLQSCNQVDEAEARYYKLSSKVESFQDAKKSGRFLVFLMSFVIGLMLISEILLIHFRIQAEQEENSRAVHSLYLMGMTNKEMIKCLRYKNFLRFIPPLILGTAFSFLPSYYLNETYKMGLKGILAGAIFGMVITTGVILSINWYSKKECGKNL